LDKRVWLDEGEPDAKGVVYGMRDQEVKKLGDKDTNAVDHEQRYVMSNVVADGIKILLKRQLRVGDVVQSKPLLHSQTAASLHQGILPLLIGSFETAANSERLVISSLI